MINLIRIVLLIVIMLTTVNLFSQERQVDNHRQYWLAYVGNVKIDDHWTINSDFSYRWINEFKEKFQFVARGGISRKLNSNLTVTAGYCYFIHYSNSHTSKTTRHERRPWEQIVLQFPAKGFLIQNRFRTEQRFFRAKNEESWQFNHRLRYQLSVQIPLKGKKIEKGVPFCSVSEEVMFNIGKEIIYNHFDQNRINVGLGYGITKNLTALVGYQHGWQKRNLPKSYINTHTIKLNLIHQLDIKEIL